MTRSTDGENPPKAALRALSAPFGEELERPLGRQGFHGVTLPEARVRLAVGYVGAETTVLDDDLPSVARVSADLPQRRLRGAATASGLRLAEQRVGLLSGDGQQLLFGCERSRLRPLLHIRAVAP